MSLTCPKCSSGNIVTDKKGFNGKKAVVGALVAGPIGALAGTHGKNKILCNCLDCGNTWDNVKYNNARKYVETQSRLRDYKNNKKLFYFHYENNDPQKAFQSLVKFEGAAKRTELDRYYKKWKDDDHLKNWLSIGAIIAVPLFLYFLVWIFS